MGQGPEPVAVADAGPLIHLYEVGALASLAAGFSAVHVPQAVWDEVVPTGRVPADRLHFVTLHQVPAADVARHVQLAALQAGERECLSLCHGLGIPLLLTDDMAARDAANKMGFRPVGSLGVVVRAFHRRRLTLAEAESILERLYSVSSLFVTRTIVDLAIEQLHHTP
jgi:predicted nucleic acid-binding protein